MKIDTVTFTFDPITGPPLTIESRIITRTMSRAHRDALAAVVDKPYDDPDIWAQVRAAIEVGIVSPAFDEIERLLTEREIVALAGVYPSVVRAGEIEARANHGDAFRIVSQQPSLDVPASGPVPVV